MFYNSLCKTSLLILSLAVASHVVYKFYRKKKREERTEINEVIMFAYRSGELKKSKYSRYVITESMDRLLHYLNSPQHSIDICMYVMTNLDIINVILKLHIRGIKIRVIIDADMAFSNGSALKRLDKQGIPVRWMKSTNLMHHKFCIVDSLVENVKCVPYVILGSLNWTNQALSGNWEDIVVTSQKDIVGQYTTEFERLWLQFKPIIDMA